jgi:hypothetical protein
MAKVARIAAQPLIDTVRPREADGPLISTVFSTYGLSLDQPNFFEHDFLPTLFGMGSVRDRGYAASVALERRLKEIYSVLIIDAHALADGARPSLHIDMLPVAPRANHAKVVLIHRKHLVRLVITSANLTHEGYRRQREVAAILDFRPEGPLAVEVLRNATEAWLGALGETATAGVRTALRAAVHQVETWPPRSDSQTRDGIAVVFGGTANPLWRQLVDTWPEGEPVLDWWICSPFWPDTSAGMTAFEAIAAGLADRGASLAEAKLTVLASADSPGERALPRFPFRIVQRLRDHAFPIRSGRIMPVRLDVLPDEMSEEIAAEQRELHAKWVLLRGPRTAVILLGSANFTRKGLGVLGRPEEANIEGCVLLTLPAAAIEAESWMPPIATGGIVEWADCLQEHLEDPPIEPESPPLWPDFIVRIEVEVSWAEGPDPTGSLHLILRQQHPKFGVGLAADPGGTPAVSLREVSRNDGATKGFVCVPLDSEAVRRVLTGRCVSVTWGAPPTSVRFPVNVAEDSKTGLPSVLGVRPDEQQLLAYFHGRISEEDLVDLLDRQAQQAGTGQADLTPQEIDRLRQLQNYLVRDFVESLFGLEDTLTQAIRYSPRAFEQALLGDFSPATLAEQVLQAFHSRRRSPTATAFQFVELIRVVSRLHLAGTDEAEQTALEEIRGRGMRWLLQTVRVAAQRSDFHTVCQNRDFRRYVDASLPKAIANQWNKISHPDSSRTAEGPTVPSMEERAP